MSEQEVVRHLLFHKSIVSLEGGGDHAGRIDEYIRLVRESKEGVHVAIEDPFERSIALAFELVLENHLDPWDLDLARFANLYLDRVRKTGEVDLLTAGRLLHMAWTILRLQSDGAKDRAEPPLEPAAPEANAWDDLPEGEWLTEDADFLFTRGVIDGQAPIDEKIRHKGDRKVTLLELVEALEEARREAALRAEIEERRVHDRAARATARAGSVDGQMHKEDLEAEIAEIWGRISALNGHPIPLTDLHDRTRDELVKALVSILFLARQNKLTVWQDDFPYGPIFVQNATKADGTVPLHAHGTN
ncbi:MAG TPA: hypothetical protein VI997_06620 [Candidatus Thermoplasmatota archaeon]|nr:hypothetical protein [Candidatus Thermoplasmatota archaeon]